MADTIPNRISKIISKTNCKVIRYSEKYKKVKNLIINTY